MVLIHHLDFHSRGGNGGLPCHQFMHLFNQLPVGLILIQHIMLQEGFSGSVWSCTNSDTTQTGNFQSA